MQREFKTIEWECDFCHCTETVVSFNGYGKPNGWGKVKTGPCGLTDYYRDRDACNSCLKKKKNKNDK